MEPNLIEYQPSDQFTEPLLSSIHAVGVLHRDLRTWNTLVNDAGGISIIDFDRANIDAHEEDFRLEWEPLKNCRMVKSSGKMECLRTLAISCMITRTCKIPRFLLLRKKRVGGHDTKRFPAKILVFRVTQYRSPRGSFILKPPFTWRESVILARISLPASMFRSEFPPLRCLNGYALYDAFFD
ncbi:hypothetical protein BDZ89DRAFT_1158463 [Hymenopellis radicata]|nr:hypothetical protein BDZ89DRAFT_1158463 [Hymenopellis radicata]